MIFARAVNLIYLEKAGNVALSLALSAPLLLAGLGLGVDASMNYLASERMQNTADQAAQSAARALVAGAKADIQQEAEFISSQAGFRIEDGALVVVNTPPASGLFKGSASHVEVRIETRQPQYFSSLFGEKPVTVSSRAVASFGQGNSTCLVALNSGASKALNVSGGVQVNLSGCDLQVNSKSLSALAASGGAVITAKNASVTGGTSLTGGAKVVTSGSYQLNAAPVSDPLAAIAEPTPSACSANKLTTAKPLTLYPGTYCGGLTVQSGGDVYLNPGVYILDNGGLIVSGGAKLTGDGVTIFLTSSTGSAFGKVVFSGSSIVKVSAPTSGSTAGLAIFGSRSMPVGTKFDFSGGANMNIDGFIYAPRAFLNWSGGSSVSTDCTAVIADTVQFSGEARFSMDTCHRYGSFAGSASVALVE